MSAARLWVVGGSGMLGQAVRHMAARRDVACVATASEVDIADGAALRAWLLAQGPTSQPTHVINCAAMTAVDACESDVEKAQRLNADGPKVLASIAAQRGWPIAHVSTDYVFGGDGHRPYEEDDPCAPKSVYGQSKRAGELAFWQALGLEHPGYVARTSWLFGPGGGNFVATMVRLMRSREAIDVVDDQHGRPTATVDLAEALLDLLGLPTGQPAAPGTYHVANAEATSWHGLATDTLKAARAAGFALACQTVRPVSTAAFLRPAPRPAYSVLATAKLEAALGRPMRPFVQALREYLATADARGDPCGGW